MRKILLLLFFIPAPLFAQVSITGKVVAAASKNPISYASVFLSHSQIGNRTMIDGAFVLTNVKSGKYSLVVSCIGYKTYIENISVANENIKLNNINLILESDTLAEVAINAAKIKHDHQRGKYLAIFIREFLGHTRNASECSILNPDLLNFIFDKNSEKLTATTSDFLIIENKALGYRIKYLLASFLSDPGNKIVSYTGHCLFEPMDSTASQNMMWEKKRVAAYHGSEMEFFRSCISYRIGEEGFTVRKVVRIPTPGRPSDSLINVKIKYFSGLSGIFRDSVMYWMNKYWEARYDQRLGAAVLPGNNYIRFTQEKGIYAFGDSSANCLLINYKNARAQINNYSTVVTFRNAYTYFDNNGVMFTPENCVVEGYWGTKRIAELLPVDYELPEGM